MDSAKEKIEIFPYCQDDIAKVSTKEGILSRGFNVAELNTSDKIHVHIRSYVDFLGGYANHGRNVLFKLHDSGKCVVKLTPIKSLIDIDPITYSKCNFLTGNPAFQIKDSIFLNIAGPGWNQEQFIPKDRYSIAWTMTESLMCHPDMKGWLNNVDEVFAPTFADIKRFEALDKDLKITHMPLGYDPDLYNKDVKPAELNQLKGRYVFGVLGSWNKRKGIKNIIRAFCKAFDKYDNVSLLLFCKYGTRPYDGTKDDKTVSKEDPKYWDIKYEFDQYTKDLDKSNMPHITLIDIPAHEKTLPNIVKRFNCLVGFSMGESTWLPGLEAMAMGIPVIQLESMCSGFTDYLNKANSYLAGKVEYVDADDELVKGTSEYYEGQKFAQGDEFELKELMQRAYKDRFSEHQSHMIERGLRTVQDYTWDRSTEKLIARLQVIQNEQRILQNPLPT